jgi:hypothetical protein
MLRERIVGKFKSLARIRHIPELGATEEHGRDISGFLMRRGIQHMSGQWLRETTGFSVPSTWPSTMTKSQKQPLNTPQDPSDGLNIPKPSPDALPASAHVRLVNKSYST